MNFQPYTVDDFKKLQATGYVQLGKLGPDLETEELQAKVRGVTVRGDMGFGFLDPKI